MEKSYPFCYSLMVLFSVIFILVSGCTTTSQNQTISQATPTPSPILTTLSAQIAPAQQSTPIPSLSPVITTQSITSDDVTQHFMDIAFGSGNTQLDRLAYNPTNQKPRDTLTIFNGNSDDMVLLESFISEFNDLSATNQFSENIKTTSTADMVIQFVSQTGMDAILKDSYSKEFKSGTISYAKVGPGIIYINNNLRSDLRDHIILRSFLTKWDARVRP
jgi:hypothetical protein